MMNDDNIAKYFQGVYQMDQISSSLIECTMIVII